MSPRLISQSTSAHLVGTKRRSEVALSHCFCFSCWRRATTRPWAPTLPPTLCPGRTASGRPGARELRNGSVTRLDARRDDGAVDEFAQLGARSLGIVGRKRFRELLDRVEIDGDSSLMQGDDVRLGCPGEACLLAI